MKKQYLFLTLFCVLFTVANAQFKAPLLKNQSYVQDYENILTQPQKDSLNSIIFSINKKSSIEMTIVILNDLQGDDISDVAVQIGRKWGVGQKTLNNGIIYIISPANRKAFISPGYGLEGDLPDITCKEISDEAVPFFKNQDWYGGIKTVLLKIQEQLDPAFQEQLKLKKAQDEKSSKAIVSVVAEVIGGIFILILVLYFVFKYNHTKMKIQMKIKKMYFLNIMNLTVFLLVQLLQVV